MEREQQQLLTKCDKTWSTNFNNQYVHFLFEEQVIQTPQAVAVVFDNQYLTYEKLNQQANSLASYLQALGVRPDIPVGICMERSLEMMIGVLGILKAGGTYVPLDPGYPNERLVFILKDIQATVLLTQKEQYLRLSGYSSVTLCLDFNEEQLITQKFQNINIPMNPGNLAYIIYTSGTTGVPKGVAMPHHPLYNLLKWQINNSRSGIGAKTLQFAPLSFDVSFQEIFSTWCSGGTLVMMKENLRRDPLSVLQFLKTEGIARLFLPFVALQQIAEASKTSTVVPTDLIEIITAGEQLQVNPSIKSFFNKLNSCTLQNQYGPSESHVVTSFTLPPSSIDWPSLPSIGRPITNARIYILDSHHRPVPIGTPGELCIGGDCVARGYLNRPELTAEKFIANPLSSSSGKVLYKTGDLARYRSDGNIEFLGRLDYQVKIRGFRVEPGEIEAVLAGYHHIREAVVVARKGNQGENVLVACLVVNQLSSFSLRELHEYLKGQLPEYMVPSLFAIVDAFPLTANGKVDRRALSSIRHVLTPASSETYVEPQTPLEKVIADIWSAVLGEKRIGIHDNFFELGGNSLLAAQVLSRTRHLLQIEVPLQVLFDIPTVKDFTLALEQIIMDEIEEIPEHEI